jgi:hypothetical protein
VGDDYHTMATVDQFLENVSCCVMIHVHSTSDAKRRCPSQCHIQTTADRYDFRRHLAEGKRNQISFYVCQRLYLQ